MKIDEKYKYINVLLGDYKLDIEDKTIAKIDEKGYIIPLKLGKTTITITHNKNKYKTNIYVSDLISNLPKEFDHEKSYLKCNNYTNEDNEILDKILQKDIEKVGIKTRAAAVEAARFLTLTFPYKINYFRENGRLTTNGIDAEGRYYHKGLYLSQNKYNDITKSTSSPQIWGCKLYSNPSSSYVENGLNCSGFVSWVLLNAGYDIKDIGAGFKEGENNDLTDYGIIKKLDNNITSSNEIKVGDLLHSDHSGGHIAIIIGIDEKNYHVAHALWTYAPTSLTKRNVDSNYVQITKYTKKEISNVFDEVVLMDKYYKKDGKLTNLWY